MRNSMRATVALLLLAACAGEENEVATMDATDNAAASDHAGMDHGGMEGAATADMAMAEGRVVDLPEPNRVRIDHDAIESIGMAAMTMTFEAKRGVDLAGIEAGDEVHFLLDRGRDGTLRLEAICDMDAADHEACMADMAAKR